MVAIGFSEKKAVLVLYAFAVASGLVALAIRYFSIWSSLVVTVFYFLFVLFFWIYLAKVKVYPEESIISNNGLGVFTPVIVEITYRRRLFEVLTAINNTHPELKLSSKLFRHILYEGRPVKKVIQQIQEIRSYRYPEIADILNKLVATFPGGGKPATPEIVTKCQKVWQKLNGKVDIDQMEPSEVAYNYLIKHGLINE